MHAIKSSASTEVSRFFYFLKIKSEQSCIKHADLFVFAIKIISATAEYFFVMILRRLAYASTS